MVSVGDAEGNIQQRRYIMPLWGTILTVLFSGIVALGTVINFFRSATKDDLKEVEKRLEQKIDNINQSLEKKIDNINQRIDWHLEGHS